MTMTTSRMETSVMTSLAELARIERERVEEEGARRVALREQAAREERERAAAHTRSQEERAAAEHRAKGERERADAEAWVRMDARERAAADVARIAAAAKVQLDADNAVREHELAVLRTQSNTRQGRLVASLAVSLVVAVVAAAGVTFELRRQIAGVERESSQLRDRERARGAEAEVAKADGTAALLAASKRASVQRSAALDRRNADLVAWAAQERRGDLPTLRDAATAASRARGDAEAPLDAYERALDRLRDDLASAAPAVTARRAHGPASPSPPPTCRDDDPICGISQGHL